MIFLFLTILLAISIWTTVRCVRKSARVDDVWYEYTGSCMSCVFSWIAVAGLLIGIAFMIQGLLGFTVIDDKISILENENRAIEARVESAVQQYQDYETGIFTDSTQEVGSDVLVLIERYPELKSDDFVQQQIELYIENHNEIKQLKLKQTDKYVLEFWLFFKIAR